MSLIAHKEVRFLYPVLPFLHVLAAGPLAAFSNPLTKSRKAILAVLLGLNLIIAGYTSQVHQRGVIDVLNYLRSEHETRQLEVFDVGFLMPCHSTPWRSHLVHPGITAWALTCEPPLDVPLNERDAYLDEADQFYKDPGPSGWINDHMGDVWTVSSDSISERANDEEEPVSTKESLRQWPQYLVFFEQLQETMGHVLRETRYTECWRGFNTHFHDDSRRMGDVIVWCLRE
jgi:phosphatidylinositol glycan class B